MLFASSSKYTVINYVDFYHYIHRPNGAQFLRERLFTYFISDLLHNLCKVGSTPAL